MKYFHVTSVGIGGMIVLEALKKGLLDADVLSFTFCSTPPSYRSLIEDRQEKVQRLLSIRSYGNLSGLVGCLGWYNCCSCC